MFELNVNVEGGHMNGSAGRSTKAMYETGGRKRLKVDGRV